MKLAFDHMYYLERAAEVHVKTTNKKVIDSAIAWKTFEQLEKNKVPFAEVHLSSFVKKYFPDFSYD